MNVFVVRRGCVFDKRRVCICWTSHMFMCYIYTVTWLIYPSKELKESVFSCCSISLQYSRSFVFLVLPSQRLNYYNLWENNQCYWMRLNTRNSKRKQARYRRCNVWYVINAKNPEIANRYERIPEIHIEQSSIPISSRQIEIVFLRLKEKKIDPQ